MSSDFTPFGETGVREGGGRRIFDNLSRVFIIARKAPRAIAKAILPCYTLGEKPIREAEKMSKYPDYISEKRRPVPTPDSIVENGQAHFGTFDIPFKRLNLLDCEKPCGRHMPDCMKKSRLTEWEAFEVHLKEGALVSAIYNTGPFGFSIFVWFDKRTGKISSWRNIVPVKKAKVASQLVDDHCSLKVKKSEYVIENDLMNGKAHACGWSENRKFGRFEIDIKVERLSPPSNVSIPFGPNKPLYSEKDFLKATGYISVNGEKFVTDEDSVSIIDDHKGYYPFRAHYDWLTTMGRCEIDGEKKFFAFNLTRNQSIDQDAYNENLIWVEGESFPLPPVTFERDSRKAKTWRIRDEHGAVDIRYELENTFYMPIHLLVVDVYYALPFGKIYGFVKDTNGKKYVVDGMLGIGEDKSTRM